MLWRNCLLMKHWAEAFSPILVFIVMFGCWSIHLEESTKFQWHNTTPNSSVVTLFSTNINVLVLWYLECFWSAMIKQNLCKWLESAEVLLIVLVLEALNLALEPTCCPFRNKIEIKKWSTILFAILFVIILVSDCIAFLWCVGVHQCVTLFA